MKLRLMGTHEEIEAVLPVLDAALEVVEVSGFYPNRGASSKLGRVYLEVHGTRSHGSSTVQADATRLDQSRGAIEPSDRGEITR